MKVLVTGGAGFIGSHIVDLLLAKGFEVVVIDNLSTGNVRNISAKVPIYQLDIASPGISNLFRVERPQVVIHQAAQVDVQKSISDPLLDARTNIIGTINLLVAAAKQGCQKMIYASSCASYGEPQADMVQEEHPLEPISLYGHSKLLGEYCVQTFHRLFHLDYTILRYANVYGPRQGVKGEGGVVSIFLQKLLYGESPIIFGDGNQTRDFVYVKDVARANVLAISKGSKQIMNISTGTTTSVNQLFELLKKQTGVDLAPQYKPFRQGDIKHSRLDPSKALNLLGWEPAYNIEQGLYETYLFYSSLR